MSDEHAKSPKRYRGSCHCGAVRFEVEADLGSGVGRCNCSICTKLGVTGAIVKPAALTVLEGEASLATYEWGPKISKRFFCKHCGVHCYGAGHLAEVGGDYVSVNLNCIDDLDVNTLELVHWDGRHDNWMGGPRSTPWPLVAQAS